MKAIAFLAVPAALLLAACASSPDAPAASDPAAHVLRVDYQADRWYVEGTAANGAALRFYTDTGGGFIIHADSAARAGIEVRTVGEGADAGRLAPFPVFKPDAALPPPIADTRDEPYRNLMFVAERSPQSDGFGDGMLGQEWFGGRVWTFDYPRHVLAWHEAATESRFVPAHTVALGFRNEDGVRSSNFPRIDATIAGESLPFLFDTGATLTLSDDALARLGDGGAKVRGTSFITAGVFDRWHKQHPEWRVLERAEDNQGAAPIIEVPELTIAGHTVGPVWFTRRPDSAFHEFMSQWMDRRVEGALGGNSFRWFRIEVDYPGARASFQRQ